VAGPAHPHTQLNILDTWSSEILLESTQLNKNIPPDCTTACPESRCFLGTRLVYPVVEQPALKTGITTDIPIGVWSSV